MTEDPPAADDVVHMRGSASSPRLVPLNLGVNAGGHGNKIAPAVGSGSGRKGSKYSDRKRSTNAKSSVSAEQAASRIQSIVRGRQGRRKMLKIRLALLTAPTETLAKKYEEVKNSVLDPHSKGMYRWDMFIAVLLIYTAILAPIEVVFTKKLEFNALFYINRFVDAGFIYDLILQFKLSYFSQHTGKWIVDRKLIALHYMKTWFLLDFLATIPWDLISWGIEHLMASASEAETE